MATIQTTIRLYDNLSKPLNNIINTLNKTTYAFADVQSVSDNAFNNTGYDAMQQAILCTSEATQNLVNHTEQLNSTLSGIGSVSSGIDAVNKSQQSFNKSLLEGNDTADNLMKTLGGYKVLSKTIGLISKSINGAVTRYDTLNNFPLSLELMDFDLEIANKSIQYLSRGIKGLPTTLDDIVSTTKRIAILNNNLENASLISLSLNNAFLASSASLDSISGATEQYLKILSTGKVDYNSWKSLQTSMSYGLTRIAESFGYAGNSAQNDLYNALQKGIITIDQFNGKLVELNQEMGGFAELAKTSTRGINTAFTNMNTAVVRGVTDIIEGIDVFLANTSLKSIENIITSIGNGFYNVLNGIARVFKMVAPYISDFEPLLIGAAAAFGLYATAALFSAGATLKAWVAQTFFNSALLASPIFRTALLVMFLGTTLIALIDKFLNTGKTATSVFGIITGGVNVVIQFFKNLGLEVANIATGISNVMVSLCVNIVTAFENSIRNVQSFFYNLLSTSLEVIGAIAAKLNELPFVQFDYSGITSQAGIYADKALAISGQKVKYESLTDSFKEGLKTYDTFQQNWAQSAFDSGAAWGDGITNKIKDMFSKASSTDGLENFAYVYGEDYGDVIDGIGNDTSSIASKLNDTQEELKFLRDIAERDAINKFTTVPLSVSLNTTNNVNSDMDLDSMVTYLGEKLVETIYSSAEAVHI